MDRYVNQDRANFQAGVVDIHLIFTAGAAGAVPSSLTVADGIASVTKSTNDYIVAFDDAYFRFLNGHGFVIMASPAATGAWEAKVTAVSVEDSTPTVTLSFYDDDGDAVALAVGDIVHFTFTMARMATA